MARKKKLEFSQVQDGYVYATGLSKDWYITYYNSTSSNSAGGTMYGITKDALEDLGIEYGPKFMRPKPPSVLSVDEIRQYFRGDVESE